jgi:hypothetical protein
VEETDSDSDEFIADSYFTKYTKTLQAYLQKIQTTNINKVIKMPSYKALG